MKRLIYVIVALLAAAGAQAHDARPMSIVIAEQVTGVFRVVVRIPPTVPADQVPAVVWPAQCSRLEKTDINPAPETLRSVSLLSCPNGLGGLPIEIDYPLYNPSISTLFRLETAAGGTVTAVLPPDKAVWIVPAEPTWLSVAGDYTRLGFSHIWEGPDHLLFVAGLMLLAALPSRIFLAITGFTAAHSITLTLATLGIVRVPILPTEAMIALSILFLAGEIARTDSNSFSRRYPVCLSFVFGLLHGLGFAGALGEIGLPQTALTSGLLFFNVGVEFGQLAFIAAVATMIVVLRRLRAIHGAPSGWFHRPRVALSCAYVLGIPAAFWFIERTAAAFAVA